MTLHPLRTIALFQGFIVAMQLVIPATAQETGVAEVLPPSAQAADALSPANNQIDAPSATLKSQQVPSDKALRAALAQTQQTPPIQKDEGGKDQNAARSTVQQPQGAAAAQVQPTTGTAASKPAGAAIAPAKQRRVRSFLIRFGAVAGAGIALGTVVALSSASPSRPPGSH